MIYSYCHLTGGLQSLPQGDPHPCEYQPNEKCMFEHNSLIVNQWAVPTITNLQSKCMFGRYHRLTLPLSDHRRGRVEFASSHSPKLVEHACCIALLYYLLPQNSELLNIKMVLNQTTKVSFPKHNIGLAGLFVFVHNLLFSALFSCWCCNRKSVQDT